MATDKFGRFTGESASMERGPPGLGFSLTSCGNYNMKNKQLKFVGAPNDFSDAVTRKYVDDFVSSQALALDIESNCFDARNNRIINVSAPLNDSDVVVKKCLDLSQNFVLNQTINKKKTQNEEEYFDAGFIRVSNIPDPMSDSDAINKKYVDLIAGSLPAMIEQKTSLLKQQSEESFTRLRQEIQELREHDERTSNFITQVDGKLDKQIFDQEKINFRTQINIGGLEEKCIILSDRLEVLDREIEKLSSFR